MDKCYRCNEVISMCPCDESTYTADDEISRLRAELAECKRDAERFVWLADRLQDIEIDLAEPSKYVEDDDNWTNAWRKAIDAACQGIVQAGTS